MSGTPITFDVAEFRALFPAFANSTQFPDATLQQNWDTSTNYIDDNGGYGALQTAPRTYALNAMTAHITALTVVIANGQVPNLVQGSTIDKISVTLTPPPLKNQFQWWLSLTPYGQQLLALLQVKSVGGFYSGGCGELAAFRRVGGNF